MGRGVETRAGRQATIVLSGAPPNHAEVPSLVDAAPAVRWRR